MLKCYSWNCRLDLRYFWQYLWNWKWFWKIFEGELFVMFWLNISSSNIFLTMPLTVRYHQNCQAAFGRCEYLWVKYISSTIEGYLWCLRNSKKPLDISSLCPIGIQRTILTDPPPPPPPKKKNKLCRWSPFISETCKETTNSEISWLQSVIFCRGYTFFFQYFMIILFSSFISQMRW